MTSLAHQLKRLALPQNDPSLLTRKQVASLLFEPRDAASLDRDHFFALGCTGLDELLSIEPAFEEFQETLFSQASKSLERSVQSKEVNQKLDAGISLFLQRLSPYFLLKSALKCLEWLIHRFHIHLYNQEALIGCVLPYHETKVFVRVVQLLKIEDPTHQWHWLHGFQKSGVHVDKGTLIARCYKDLGFLDFICSLVTKSIKAYPGSSESCSQLRVMFSFYASSVVLAVDAVEKVSDALIARLLPYIQKGLKSSLMDYRSATYMIVCQLAVKVVMEGHLVDTLALQISKSVQRAPASVTDGVGCLIVLLQNQKTECIGPKVYSHLCAVSALVPTLRDMAATFDISPLLRYLLPHLIHSVVTSSSDTEMDKSSDVAGVLQSVLQDLPLSDGLDNLFASQLLKDYLSHGSSSQLSRSDLNALNQRLKPFIRAFESKNPGALDAVLESYHGDISDMENQNLFHQFISMSLSSGKFKMLPDSDTSLLLSLKHPLPSVRNLALGHIRDIVATGQEGLDEAFLREAILERLKDDVPEVVLAAINALEVTLESVEAEVAVSSLLSLLKRTDLSTAPVWFTVVKETIRLLQCEHLLEASSTLKNKVARELLPLLVFNSNYPDSVEHQLATCVAQSSLMAQYPLTKGWDRELRTVKAQSPSQIIETANQQLISTMTKNIASMEPLLRRSTLEDLVESIGSQKGSLKERAAFFVLTYTLVQCMGDLPETQHLHTAQRVFTLLEPYLQELCRSDSTQGSAPPDQQQMDSPFLVSGVFVQYLYLLREGQAAEQEQGRLLVRLLKDFIHAVKCPAYKFKGKTWWNPEKLDSATCCYLHLLVKLFDLTVTGAIQGPLALTFQALAQLLFQVHLNDPTELFKFLSLLWCSGGNLGDQPENRVNPGLQTKALYVGGALLCRQPEKVIKQLASTSSPVLVSLVACLNSPVREVRRAAVEALHTFSGVESSPFHLLVNKLLQGTEELITDPAHLSQTLWRLYEEAQSGKSRTREKMLAAIQQLLLCIQFAECPSIIGKTLLRALREVNGEPVLEVLLPAIERLLEQCGPESPTFLKDEALLLQLLLSKYNEHAAPLLVRSQNCQDVFVRAMNTTAQPFPGMPSFQVIAIEQITKSFFAAIGDEKTQQRLLGVMFDQLVDCRNPTLAQTINGVFKAIAVDAELVAFELLPTDKPKASGTVQQVRKSKILQRKTQDPASGPPEGSDVSWSRVALILELLQHKKKLKKPQMLVPCLFSLLSRCLELSHSEQVNLEYTKQLILSCLLNICHKLSADGGPISKDVLDEDKFNVELVVQCVRGTNVPQTHHQALLLLGAVAGMLPEKVLHNIMPIFTFMGANIMRLDDIYSFQVINKTVQTVIPALLKAHDVGSTASGDHMDCVVTRIAHVFVDALPHVPEHRRLPILAQLVGTLGPARYLWMLLLLLFKQYVTQSVHGDGGADKEAALESDTEFWISVCCEFAVEDQLTSLVKVLQYLAKLPQDKEDDPAKKRHGKRVQKEDVETLIFSVETHSSKELRHYKFLSVSFMAQLLASSSFVGMVAEHTDAPHQSLERLQQSLLEEILCYINTVARCMEAHSDKPSAKFWRALLSKTYDVLDKVNALLPTDTFITVMRGLMGNKLPSVRRKALELLNNKLQHRTSWQEDHVKVLLAFTEDLITIVSRGHSEEEEEEQAVNRQTALYSLKLLCRNFGATNQDAFVPVLKSAVGLVISPDEDRNVMGSALLCVAEVTSVLKALAIPQLPRLMPAVLQALKKRKELFSNEIYLLSAVTALQRITETLPHFISPYLQDTLLQVARFTCVVERGTMCPQLGSRLASLRSTLASNVTSRILLPAISTCYSQVVVSHQSHLRPLLEILQNHISDMPREQLNTHQAELSTFFLSALDFRAQHGQADLEKANEIEGYVINCLLVMVLKLSEVTFRPLFFKLFDWCKMEGAPKDRLLTFCHLSDCIAEKLKGLFVLFATHLVKLFSDLLSQTNITKTDKGLFEGEDDASKSCLLLQYMLDCLHKIFLYDTQRFVNKERADALMTPLVDQLENTLGGEAVYQKRITDHLVPCVAQFSVALRDDSLWKPLNYQILLKMRDSSAKVRFSALIMLLELTRRLRENYIVLLPETIPFLAELMEDECEEVEHQVQKVIQEMEVILGEPLQNYF